MLSVYNGVCFDNYFNEVIIAAAGLSTLTCENRSITNHSFKSCTWPFKRESEDKCHFISKVCKKNEIGLQILDIESIDKLNKDKKVLLNTDVMSVSLDVIKSIRGVSFSDELGPSISLKEKFSSITNLFPEGHLSDSLWFLKEITLSKTLDGIPSVNAYFDLSKTKNVVPQIFYTVGSGIIWRRPAWRSWIEQAALIEHIVPWGYLNKYIALTARLVLDTSFLGAQAYSYGRALQASVQYFRAQQKIGPLSLRSATFLAITGLEGVISTFIQGYNLCNGIRLFSTLDEIQQKAVLKHRALHVIVKDKNCNAVIIDGISSDWSRRYSLTKMMDDLPSLMAELFYEKCHTQTYRVSSDEELCNVLKTAEEHFGSPIDKLALLGHASGRSMILNDGYNFTDTDKAIASIDRAVKSEGQIVVLGCNTATRDAGGLELSLAERISVRLPSRRITGIKAYLSPFIAIQQFSNNTFSYHSFAPLNSKKELVLENSVVTYQNGEETRKSL